MIEITDDLQSWLKISLSWFDVKGLSANISCIVTTWDESCLQLLVHFVDLAGRKRSFEVGPSYLACGWRGWLFVNFEAIE